MGRADMSLIAFRHSPLDRTQPSIRLLKVLPTKSGTGLVQCEITHATTNIKYKCLSYVWGNEDDHGGPFEIIVNGKRLFERYNLYAFLDIAGIKYPNIFL